MDEVDTKTAASQFIDSVVISKFDNNNELLAKRLGVARSSVSRWRSGAVQIDPVNLRRVCEIVGTTLEQALKSDDKPDVTRPHKMLYQGFTGGLDSYRADFPAELLQAMAWEVREAHEDEKRVQLAASRVLNELPPGETHDWLDCANRLEHWLRRIPQ